MGVKEFLDFVSSTCHDVYKAQPDICKVASDNLDDEAQKLVKLCRPVGLILSLYSSALHFKSNIPWSQNGETAPLSSDATILCNQQLEYLTSTIQVLSSDFSEKREDGNASGLFLAYMDALEFWCRVLLPCVETGWKHFCFAGKDFSNSPNWSNVFEVLQVFCSSDFNFKASSKSGEVDKGRTNKKRELLLKSLESGFRICCFSATTYEKCCEFIGIVLSSEWISPIELMCFSSSINNTVVQLSYNIQSNVRHAFKAPVEAALNLYNDALAKLRRICHNHLRKLEDISNDELMSIKETLLDGYEKIGLMILILNELHPGEVTSIANITVRTLSEMSLVDDLLSIQSNSFSLVKAWVKVLCIEYNDANKKYDAPFLYNLLTKNQDKKAWSRMSLGRIVENELLAYQQLESEYPNLCKMMQEKVFEVLLEDLYSEKNSILEGSNILVAKARALRTSGVDGLSGSLDCLSEAISLLRDAKSDSSERQALAYHQLAITYCLHAQCAQENKLHFEVIMGDITSALDLLSKIDIEHYNCCNGGFELVATNMVLLLCTSIDLLSIKGCYKHHSSICMLMSKAYPAQKLFALLFSHRQLGHTNCGVQMDLELISSTLQNCDASAHLTEFWAGCLKGNNASLSMFSQSLLLSCLPFPEINEKSLKIITVQNWN